MTEADVTARARAFAEAFDRSFAEPRRVREDEGAPALAIRVGGDPYVLLVEGLTGVSRRQHIVPLPGGPPAQLGLSGIRGGLVAVFSLPALLGYEVAVSQLAWLVVVASHQPVALAFEALDKQISVPSSSISAAPSGARRHVAGLVRAAGDPSARGLLDLPSLRTRLFPQAV